MATDIERFVLTRSHCLCAARAADRSSILDKPARAQMLSFEDSPSVAIKSEHSCDPSPVTWTIGYGPSQRQHDLRTIRNRPSCAPALTCGLLEHACDASAPACSAPAQIVRTIGAHLCRAFGMQPPAESAATICGSAPDEYSARRMFKMKLVFFLSVRRFAQ
jgi:hypothetical protein